MSGCLGGGGGGVSIKAMKSHTGGGGGWCGHILVRQSSVRGNFGTKSQIPWENVVQFFQKVGTLEWNQATTQLTAYLAKHL